MICFTRHLLATTAVVIAGLSGMAHTVAQGFPDRPIKLVVPVSPGGGTDMVARLMADAMSASLGQPIVVTNQGGAGGQIATQATARAAADGYSLMLGYVSTHGTLPVVRHVPYDPVGDFTPIVMIGGAPNVLVGPPDGPTTFKDFLLEVKREPTMYSYASAGAGTITHLVFERLKSATGISLTHIPYRGIGPAMTDLLSGQVSFSMAGLAGVLPYIRTGKLRALAVTGANRHPLIPDVPTLKELGVTDFESVQWLGIMGPAGLPAAVTARLSAAGMKVLKDPDFEAKLASEGIQIIPLTGRAFSAYVAKDIERWAAIVKERNLKEN
jgi:tripartite-type tricarboxylate transporter receptor subunit TctC